MKKKRHDPPIFLETSHMGVGGGLEQLKSILLCNVIRINKKKGQGAKKAPRRDVIKASELVILYLPPKYILCPSLLCLAL